MFPLTKKSFDREYAFATEKEIFLTLQEKMFYTVTPKIFISLFNLISQIAQIYFEFDLKVKLKIVLPEYLFDLSKQMINNNYK